MTRRHPSNHLYKGAKRLGMVEGISTMAQSWQRQQGTAVLQGALGECGLRGGMLEATNIHPGTLEQIYKIASINLSPNTTGQAS